MDDDQTCPEHVLLLAMERAFRGPEYKDTMTSDWQPHLKRVLQCVRENDPVAESFRAEITNQAREIEKLPAATLGMDMGGGVEKDNGA